MEVVGIGLLRVRLRRVQAVDSVAEPAHGQTQIHLSDTQDHALTSPTPMALILLGLFTVVLKTYLSSETM